MSKRSVRAYLAGILETAVPALMVFDAWPTTRPDADHCYIRKIRSKEVRAGFSGRPGRKQVTHKVTVRVMTPNRGASDAQPLHLDDLEQGVKAVLRATALPQRITDTTATPTERSDVTAFGETIEDDFTAYADYAATDLLVEVIEEVLG